MFAEKLTGCTDNESTLFPEDDEWYDCWLLTFLIKLPIIPYKSQVNQ